MTADSALGPLVDGEVVVPGFELDLQTLRMAFGRLEDVTWRSHLAGEHDRTAQTGEASGVRSGSPLSKASAVTKTASAERGCAS